MRVLSWFAVLVGLAFAGPVAAVDFTKIDRSIRKEPIYQSKNPLYCLFVFGPEAEIRVWVVLDGDVLYLDRNGNGDLTDPGERIAARDVYRNLEERPDVELMRHFELNCWKAGEEPVLTCGPEVKWFYVHQLVPREDGTSAGTANSPSPACPDGLGDEEAIRAVWAAASARPGKSPSTP